MNKVLTARYPKRLNLVRRAPFKSKEKKLSFKPFLYIQAFFNICFISALYFLWDSVNLNRKDFVEDKVYAAKRNTKFDEQNEKVAEILKFLLSSTKAPKQVVSTQAEKLVGQVSGPKANLRSAPNAQSDILMVLTGPTKILIEGESGDYYQVTAPTGEKAFVAKSLVQIPTDIG